MSEIWRDIPGYEGLYQVSNMGNVKSLKWGKERILKKSISNHGYYRMFLRKENKQNTFTVHQLVAMAFLGHTPNGYETVVNHIDNNPLNNNLDNLELVTNRYNSSCHKTDAGVCLYKPTNKWRARISILDNYIHLGYFINKQDALDMYQKALDNTHLYDGDAKKFRAELDKQAIPSILVV